MLEKYYYFKNNLKTTMHKSMTQHLTKAQELNNYLIDMPECLLEASQENDILFDYLLLVTDIIYAPMISNEFLSYTEVLDLYETFTRLRDSINYLNSIKLIGLDFYLNAKITKVYDYALENELFEIVQNINHFNNIKEQVKNMQII